MRLFFTGFLLFSFLSIQAQFKNILIDPGTSEKRPYEPTIAINRDNPKNIVVISALNNVYYSANSGLSWKKTTVNSSLGVGNNPLLQSDFKGSLSYFHLPADQYAGGKTFDRIIVQQSDDEGETWNDGSAISGLDPAKGQYYARAVVDRKGNWYATWSQFDNYGSDDPGCQSVILLSTSSNGKKWSKPEQVSQTVGDCKNTGNSTIGSSVAVTANGDRVFIAWAHQDKILLDRSFDGGKMWLSTDLPVAQQPRGAIMKVPGLDKCNGMPQLVADNTKSGKFTGALYVVWADQRNGENDTDIWLARSINFADSWAQALRINNDGKGKHQFLPATTIDQTTGHIYIVYYDRRNYEDTQTDVYLAYSIDAGSSFKNLKISETPFTPSADGVFGDYIGISAHDGIITPVWTRMDKSQTSIWMAVIKHEELEKIK